MVYRRATLLRDTFTSSPERCGLLLHQLLHNRALLVRCVIYDSLDNTQTYEIRETCEYRLDRMEITNLSLTWLFQVMRMGPNYPNISPDYVSKPNEDRMFEVTLFQPDGRYFTYEFPSLQGQ